MIRKYLQDLFSYPFQAGLLTSEFELVDLLFFILLEVFSADALILIRNTWYLGQSKVAFRSAKGCI